MISAKIMYKSIMQAAQAFGLQFYDLEYIKVKVETDRLIFTFEQREFVVLLNK